MTAQVVVYIGPARSGKTYELVRQYRVALAQSDPNRLDCAIWLAPNGRTAAAIRGELVRAGLDACLRPGVLTFDDLAREVLTATHARLRSVAPALERELLRRVVAQAVDNKRLTFFADSARRSGFIDLLAQHIAELKRRDIRPDTYASSFSHRTRAEQQSELAELYADYELLLATHALMDRESEHRAARDALAKNTCARFRNLELIVADGFTDFTHTQREILRLLSQDARQLLITLPGEVDSLFRGGEDEAPAKPRARNRLGGSLALPRSDLFAKTVATLRDLKTHFPRLEVRQFAPRPLACPAIDHLAQLIFGHPRHVPTPTGEVLNSLANLTIIEAAGAQDEVVQIARRVKALLTDAPLPFREGSFSSPHRPTRPGDILVVFRSLADVAPRVREVFERFGIPYYLDAARPVAASSFMKTLLDLLALKHEDWRFRRVVSVITNNTITAFDGDSRRAAEWLVRDLQIPSGGQALLNRVQGLATESSPPNMRSEHLERRVRAATIALPTLERLSDALQALPETATATRWRESLSGLAEQLKLLPLANQSATIAESDPLSAADLAAWNSIAAHLASLERLDQWLGKPPRTLSRSELLVTLGDMATHESLPRNFDDTGCVRILAAPAARNIAARHVFLAGMSEQAFPSPERAGNLASDADYYQLERARENSSRAERPAAPSYTRAQAEMLLLYEIVSRAEETLTISYPALDDKAQSLPPSPYVVELERLFRNDENRSISRVSPQLSPVSKSTEPSSTDGAGCRSTRGTYCVADWRIQAIAAAVETDGGRRSLAGIYSCKATKPLAAAIDAGLRIVDARARGDSFGAAEGLLAGSAIAVRMAERFGRQHAWSASQWETYASCPFRFFMRDVLRLEPLGDLVLETDFARRGSRLHDVLAAFHRQWLTLCAEPKWEAGQEATAFLAHLQQVTKERTATTSRVGVDAALLELDRRQIFKWANSHFENQTKYDGSCKNWGLAMTPTYFEFRFGSSTRGDSQADPNSTANDYEIDIGGEPIRVTGQIDRIDVGQIDGKTVFNVIDYKSGRRATLKPDQLATGQQLQLPIYVEAAQALVFRGEAIPLAAGYWSMGGGFDAKGALAGAGGDDNRERWRRTQADVHQLIGNFINRIRHGEFPVDSLDDKCTSTCDFHMVCRVAQVRSLGKKSRPEAEGL